MKDKLKELKLEKRRLLLSGKRTEEVDIKIKEIEIEIKQEDKQ
ncbi:MULTISPECIES: hypothetical protein [Clostridium]|nr:MULTISPECIES: hypothetical protein [Clostridium]MDU2756733.1 hypothetical protein [Clostridium sp.]